MAKRTTGGFASVGEVAQRLHLSPPTVRRLVREGSLPALIFPGQHRVLIRIPRDAFERILAAAEAGCGSGG